MVAEQVQNVSSPPLGEDWPQAWRWNKDQYHRMAELGFFHGMRVELLEGEVWEKYPTNVPFDPYPVHWTLEQYYKMEAEGWFENKRVELIEGEVLEMSPVNSRHWTAVILADEALRRIFTTGHFISVQGALQVESRSQPVPDVAVIEGKARDYKSAIPMVGVLVVEVSDTTLHFDQTRKAVLYARAGIPEYWIVNLRQNQLEVHRRPERNKAGQYLYREKFTLESDETISPLASPDASIAVADLLP